MESHYITFEKPGPGRIVIHFSRLEADGIVESLDSYDPGEGVLGDLKAELDKWL